MTKNIKNMISDCAEILENESMKKHTTFGIGGNAALFIIANSSLELPKILHACTECGIKSMIIGNGSNLLFPDEDLDIAVIKTQNNDKNLNASGDLLCAPSGIILSSCATFAYKNRLSGLEFAHGIPGSVGGAVFMNAGAYDSEISCVAVKTHYCDMYANEFELIGTDHDFGYRQSFFKNHREYTILDTTFKLHEENPEKIRMKMEELMIRRKSKQPLEYKSAGSVFKRPNGMFAGKLIEDCGLKGYRIGGAEVSEKHAGFIINRGNATSRDVKLLIDHIKNTVIKTYGVELECEIQIVKP